MSRPAFAAMRKNRTLRRRPSARRRVPGARHRRTAADPQRAPAAHVAPSADGGAGEPWGRRESREAPTDRADRPCIGHAGAPRDDRQGAGRPARAGFGAERSGAGDRPRFDRGGSAGGDRSAAGRPDRPALAVIASPGRPPRFDRGGSVAGDRPAGRQDRASGGRSTGPASGRPHGRRRSPALRSRWQHRCRRPAFGGASALAFGADRQAGGDRPRGGFNVERATAPRGIAARRARRSRRPATLWRQQPAAAGRRGRRLRQAAGRQVRPLRLARRQARPRKGGSTGGKPASKRPAARRRRRLQVWRRSQVWRLQVWSGWRQVWCAGRRQARQGLRRPSRSGQGLWGTAGVRRQGAWYRRARPTVTPRRRRRRVRVVGLFDVHAHLTHPKLAPQIGDILARAAAAGLTTIVSNGLNPQDNEAVRALARARLDRQARLWPLPGGCRAARDARARPRLPARERARAQRRGLRALGARPRRRGICDRRDRPRRLLGARGAVGASRAELSCAGGAGHRGRQGDHHPHPQARAPSARDPARRWAPSGSIGTASAASSSSRARLPKPATGCPFPPTRAAPRALRACCETLPRDKVLLETDCPYLGPDNDVDNEPGNVRQTLSYAAELWNVSEDAAEAQLGANFSTLFGVSP